MTVQRSVETRPTWFPTRSEYESYSREELLTVLDDFAWTIYSLRDRDEIIARECDQYGLPHSLPALLRHIRNNHAATVGVKDWTIELLTNQRDEARATAAELQNAAETVVDMANDPQIDIGSPVWDAAVQQLREVLR